MSSPGVGDLTEFFKYRAHVPVVAPSTSKPLLPLVVSKMIVVLSIPRCRRRSRPAPFFALLRLDPCREGAPLERFLSIKLSLYSRFYLYYLKLFNVYLSLLV